MLARVRTGALAGISAIPVDVEVQTLGGKKDFSIIGLGDTAVKESRDRVISALRSSGHMIESKILVNLAPAGFKKEGSSFDLAIALGVLASSGEIERARLKRVAAFGELSLDGTVRPVCGTVALAIEAVQNGAEELLVPPQNEAEAALATDVRIAGVRNLRQMVSYLRGELELKAVSNLSQPGCPEEGIIKLRGFSEVAGQETAKRALLIAAAGAHNVLMIGPPGCGKSMLASRLPSILPPLSREETLESVKIHSIAGQSVDSLLAGIRPYRNPHHVISETGLTGGGSNPRPGEISLAHNGILFLDEFPEFRRAALEAMRAPLETGSVLISRARASVEFPADFQLIAAMNTCPCGKLGVKGLECICSPSAVRNYHSKISQPILDRIDIHVELDTVPVDDIIAHSEKDRGDDTKLLDIVLRAREMARQRTGVANSALSNDEVIESLNPTGSAMKLLKKFSSGNLLSARSYFRVLKIARTIADLEGQDSVRDSHLAEALSYRKLDRLKG